VPGKTRAGVHEQTRTVSALSLRTRLYVVLGALFLVPLLVGALVLAFAVPNVGSDLLENRILGSAGAVRSEIGDECSMLGLAARSVALESGAATSGEAVANAVKGRYATYAAVLKPDGSVLADVGRLPEGAGPPADLPACTGAQGSGPVLAASVHIDGVAGASRAVAALTVERDREPVRLVADPLQQLKAGAMGRKQDRLGAARDEDLLDPLREGDHRDPRQVELLHRLERGGQLTLATVDHDEVRRRRERLVPLL